MSNAPEICNKPKLCFVARYIGYRSEVWIWRQIVGITQFQPHVLTWDYINRADYPLEEHCIHQLPFLSNPENGIGFRRWFYRLRNLPSANFYGTTGKEREYINRLFSEIKPEVILCHFGFTGLRILPVARRFRIPIVAYFHGLDISSSLANRWYRWSLVRHSRDFDAIIVVGNHQQQWFLDHGVPKSRIYVIPCGVPTEQFTPPWAKSNGIVKYVSVSRLDKQKGIDYTIKAFQKVAKIRPNVHLNIIGEGEEMNNLRDLVSLLEIAHKVTFSGDCPPAIVKQHLAEAHIFLQHSTIREGSPVSIAEAAAMELPIVATRCGGIVDQVVEGKTGYLVEQGDVNGMAEAMIKLAENSDLRVAMGRAGRERMIRHFDTKKQITKLEAVLLDCCRD